MNTLISVTEHRLQCPSCFKVWAWRTDHAQHQCPNCGVIGHAPHPDQQPLLPISPSDLWEAAVQLEKENTFLRAEVERLTAENAQARHKGRMEALDAVFQINGPARAIARLKEKYTAEAVRP